MIAFIDRSLAAALVAAAFGPLFAASAQEPAYGVPDKPWDLALGQHRAVVHVDSAAPAVSVHLPWRLQIQGMENHGIIVVDAATGKQLKNVVRFAADRVSCDLGFQPATVPGDYYIYYLPPGPGYRYDGDKGWLEQANSWRNWPEAKLLEFQARTDLDRFDPMEIIASETETKDLLSRNPGPMLLFPEDRRRPIRMQHDLPLTWIKTGPRADFSGEAERDEYYAFQIGVFAPKQAINNLVANFTALRSPDGGVIPAAALTCFNTGGVDCFGHPFTKEVNVTAGAVQPLWIGVDVARDQKPGSYAGAATIQGDGVPPQTVNVRLTVSADVIKDRGDDETWRHSRLRWLNSTAGSGGDVVPPYTPLVVDGRTIHCLGRSVTLGDNGLPSSIVAGQTELLAEPLRFIAMNSGSLRITKQTPGEVEWESGSCRGKMDYDGRLEFAVTTGTSGNPALEIPLIHDAAPYMIGIGCGGGYRPKEYEWKWSGPYNSFWIGGVHAGLYCKLLGGSYEGPMLNLYHPAPPASWWNSGNGGVSIREENGNVVARAFTGERKSGAGTETIFRFALLITPVKPIDTAWQFHTRFYHGNQIPTPDGYDPAPPPDALAAGVNVVNVHHATLYNPYINYPYLKTAALANFVSEMHKRNVKVKIYDTVREVSNSATELWALRSLGTEIIAGGGGGGSAWLQEHLITGYTPGWFISYSNGPPDAALVTSGESRWYNYYVEGVGWLVRNTGADGLYLDDVAYDRTILKRVRSVMNEAKPGCLIDLHSNAGFSAGPTIQYAEFLPYLDRLWFGESFDYNGMTPDQWLVQVSGIPFGVMGEMLYQGGNPWRGTLYGMTNRLGWQTEGARCDPRPVWRIWDLFGIADAKMIGYWEPDCPVRTDNHDVLATVYRKPDQTLIALASWAPAKTDVRLTVDWKALGLDPGKVSMYAPRSAGFQSFQQWKPGDPISVSPRRGLMIIADETGPKHEDSVHLHDVLLGRHILLEENFHAALGSNWKVNVSRNPGTSVSVTGGDLNIHAAANVTACADLKLPAGATAVECSVDPESDGGETWGPGLALCWPGDKAVRVYIRVADGAFGIDATGRQQQIHLGRLNNDGAVLLRIRLDAGNIYAEVRNADEDWQILATLPRAEFPGQPVLARIGKCGSPATIVDHTDPGAPGDCDFSSVRVYGQ